MYRSVTARARITRGYVCSMNASPVTLARHAGLSFAMFVDVRQ